MNKVYADSALFESLSEFVDREGIQIELSQEDGSKVRILVSDDPKESGRETLYAGGWIACRTALAMAQKLELPTVQIGALLNHLNIKVKNCSLGCF
ncbi:MAG: hypothetical protein ACYS72_03965 [Planctomycetota bacterium]|jgi:hypothetical protein